MKSHKVYCQGHKEAKKSKSECTDEQATKQDEKVGVKDTWTQCSEPAEITKNERGDCLQILKKEENIWKGIQ